MIDADKYEGHTRGPWSVKSALFCVTEEVDGSYQVDIVHKPDKLLFHDAPLLLAEVKRLREGIKEQMQFALDCVGSDIRDLYETIADDLRRLIE